MLLANKQTYLRMYHDPFYIVFYFGYNQGVSAKECYSWPNIIKRNLKIFKTAGIIGGVLPAGTNVNFRRYYKKDFYF